MRRSVEGGRPAIGLLRMCWSDEAYASIRRLTSEACGRLARAEVRAAASWRNPLAKTKLHFRPVRDAACVYNGKLRLE